MDDGDVTDPIAMPADAPTPPTMPLSPMFIYTEMNRRLGELQTYMDRRTDRIELRVEQLDEHGTRGVDGLRTEVRQLRTDMEQHEKLHMREHDEQRASRRWFTNVLIALLVPLYPALGWVIIRLARG